MADKVKIAVLVTKTLAAAATITGVYVDDDTTQFVAAQVQATAELVENMQGTPTSVYAGLYLAQAGLGFTNIAQDQLIKCHGNLLALGLDATMALAEAPTGWGAAVAALEIVSDLYNTAADCGPLMARAPATIQRGITYWVCEILYPLCTAFGDDVPTLHEGTVPSE